MTVGVFRSDAPGYQRDDGIWVFQRRAFCRDYFHYRKGEHAVFGGPSTRGKTTMAFDLLEPIVSPELPAFFAVSKPEDPVTRRRGIDLDLRFVEEWPPAKTIGEIMGGKKPNGYVIWPHFGDLNTDMQRCAEVTGNLLMDRYAVGASKKNKGGILVMDDTMVKAKIMGLDSHMVTILAMAGAMGLGLWIFVQKPTDSGRTTTWGYEMATHLFFTKGGDERMLRRYVEILGEHGEVGKRVIPTLEPYQFLYVHKVEGWMCIVEARPK